MALICCCFQICAAVAGEDAGVADCDGDCDDCCFSCCFEGNHASHALTAVDTGLRTAEVALVATDLLSSNNNSTYVPLVITNPPATNIAPLENQRRPPNSQDPNETNEENGVNNVGLSNTGELISNEYRSIRTAPPSYDEAMGAAPNAPNAPSAPRRDDNDEKMKQ